MSRSGTLDLSGLTFTNAAQISPGGGFGTGVLQINGSVTSLAGAALYIEIFGPPSQPDQFDHLSVSGSVQLSGTLDINRSLLPVEGDVFTILTAGSLTGTFDTINGAVIGGGLVFVVSYTATSVVLTVTATEP